MSKKNKPGQGRKPLGQDRGGLVPLMVSIYADQAERLREGGNKSLVIRVCLDKFFAEADRNAKKPQP